MKKTFIFISLTILTIFMFGCSVEQPDWARVIGIPESINEADSITILSAEITNGSITVTMDLDLNILTLNDFDEIYIVKTEAHSKQIKLNIEKSKALNSTDIFNAPFSGKALLYFEDSSIKDTHKPFEYLIYMTIIQYDGISSTHKFMLG